MNSAEYARSRLLAASDKRISIVPYVIINDEGEEELHNATASRSHVKKIFPYFLHLLAHLRASTKILRNYTSEDFSKPHPKLDTSSLDSSSIGECFGLQIVKDQILFTHHHSAVSETPAGLKKVLWYAEPWEMFGLLNGIGLNWARIYFCHGLLRPGWASAGAEQVEKVKGSHKELLRQVEATTTLLKDRLGTEYAWWKEIVEEKELGLTHMANSS